MLATILIVVVLLMLLGVTPSPLPQSAVGLFPEPWPGSGVGYSESSWYCWGALASIPPGYNGGR
jgi:hypothetical protein